MLRKYKNLSKDIVPKVGISIILQKPSKQMLLNLLTFKKKFLHGCDSKNPSKNLQIEGYDLRQDLLQTIGPQVRLFLNYQQICLPNHDLRTQCVG